MSAFTRIIIVLSLLRQALGTQQTPPNQVLIALALFLTAFVMQPTLTRINDQALQPYLAGTLAPETALAKADDAIKTFMLHNTRKDDLRLFAGMTRSGPFAAETDVPLTVLLPAFMTSEIKSGFQIGFLLYLPFLVIDMVIASILMALGMMMLSPMLISAPFKILLFVLVDGWVLVVGSIAGSFNPI